MKTYGIAFAAVVAFMLGATSLANAVVLDSGTYTWTGTESTQTGRTFRDGIASTWAAPKSHPGVVAGTFPHILFNPVGVGSTTFLEITLTGTTIDQLAVGYNDTMDSTDITTNYVGDPGASDPVQTFQVTLAPDAEFRLNVEWVRDVTASGTFSYRVDAFLDANRTEPGGTVPEPSTLLLLGSGMIGLGWLRLRKR